MTIFIIRYMKLKKKHEGICMKSRRRTHISVKPSSKFCFPFSIFFFTHETFFCLFNFFIFQQQRKRKKAAYKDQFGKWFDKACIVLTYKISMIQKEEEERGNLQCLYTYSIDFCFVYFCMYFLIINVNLFDFLIFTHSNMRAWRKEKINKSHA